jgi:class 3 adenylate cyclase/tetratricopeptide (TPR) repeat protein
MKSKKEQFGCKGQLGRPKSSSHCRKCGNVMKKDSVFCATCGAEIDAKRSKNSDAQPTPPSPAPKLVGEKVLAFAEAQEVERKYVTMLIGDIADYASLSEKLSPEEQYRVVAYCLALLQEQVSRYGGTMTQTTRGTVKAVFGAPQAFERHANRACEAALSITKLISDYSKRLREEHGLELQMRIGLVSGLILSGSVSTGADINYEDLEDVDDLIPAVQAALRPGTAVVTSSTYKLVSNFFEFRPLEEFAQQSADQHVELYELLRARQFLGPIESKRLRGLSKFVGREREMSILLEAIEEARKGIGQAIAIVGEAGVGKSRLVFEFENSLPRAECSWLDGYCRSYDGVPPYHPFLDVLRLSFGIKPGEKEGSIKRKILQKQTHFGGSYEEIVAPLHEILALTVEDERYLALGFQEKRRRILQAVEKILVGETRDKTLVVVLEDLHWIDPSSEELLAYLVERISGAKILLIVLYRPEYDGAYRLGRGLRQIRLGELLEEPMRMLTSSVLGGSEVDNGIVDVIRDKTGGNPLFVEEFAMSLRESEAIREVDGKFFLENEAQTSLLPQTIQNVMSARIDRLKKEVKTTLQVASVIGREVPFRLLERVRAADRSIESDILRLQQLEFVHEKVESAEREYMFKHALTQEAAYHGMSRQKRTLIHEEVGSAIEQSCSGRIEECCEQLAYHFSRSGNAQKEFHYLKLSATKASRQNSMTEAFRFIKEALRCLRAQPASEQSKREELELLIWTYGVLVMLDFRPSDSEQLLKRGVELAVDLHDVRCLSHFRSALYIYYSSIGDATSARKYSEHLLNDIGALEELILTKDQLRIIVPAAIHHAMSGVMAGRFSETLPVNLKVLMSMEGAQTLVESYGMPMNEYSLLAASSAGSFAWLGDFDNAMIWLRKGLNAAIEAQNMLSVAIVESWFGIVLMTRGFGEEAIEHTNKAAQYYEEAGATWLPRGYARFLTGDLDGALQCMEKAIRMLLDSDLLWYVAFNYAVLAMVHSAIGDLSSARSCVAAALDWSQKLNQKHWDGFAKIILGKILGESDLLQAAKAEATMLEGIDILTQLGMKPYCAQGYLYLGELYSGTGRTPVATNNLKKAERMFRQMGMDYWLRKTEGALSRLRSSQR